ncbi:MAG: SDR family NAD(P)-dependent oxidoreductase [Pseudomonadota bacterium]
MRIKESLTIITGGGSGLGAACAEMVVGEGGQAVIFDLDADRGTTTADALGDGCQFAHMDVTDESSVTDGLTIAKGRGAVRALINCAGVASAAKTLGRDGAHTLELFRKVQDINLTGSFNVARLVAAAMADNVPDADGERGVIVNTASVAAFDGQKGQAAYAASKGGIAALSLPMARDLASVGVRVNAVAPGLFLTPLLQGLPEAAQAALADQPLFPKRLGHPSEFAHVVKFILENPYMNGEVIRLDAGIRLP